ncbi:MAG: aliphatic nitrilase, partial [Nodosilinea sp.]
VVNATGWLSAEQVAQITPDEGLQRALRGGCYTAIISPEGVPLATPVMEGEGMAIADLDFALITKRKRMMDAVGHYARPDLLQLQLNPRPWSVVGGGSPTDPADAPICETLSMDNGHPHEHAGTDYRPPVPGVEAGAPGDRGGGP